MSPKPSRGLDSVPKIEFTEYVPRRPANVDAIQITTENIVDVAKLVGGRVERLSKASDPTDVSQHLLVPHIDGPFRIDLGWYLTRGRGDGTYGKETPSVFEDGYEPRTTTRYPAGIRALDNPLVSSVEERTHRG